MEKLDLSNTLERLTKATGKWGMMIVMHGEDLEEIVKAAPYLKDDDAMQMLADEHGFLLFNTEEEMNKAFDQTVGDEGSTKSNPYMGAGNVYAVTCNPNGETLNENT